MQKHTHRDGLTLSHHNRIRTSTAHKPDGRGCTKNSQTYVGETEIGQYGWYVVLAFPADIHHGVMTPDEADAVAEALMRFADRVRSRRDNPGMSPATISLEALA